MRTERTGSTSIPLDMLGLVLTGPHGDIRMDALTAVVEDRDAGDLPQGVVVGNVDCTDFAINGGVLEISWIAEVDDASEPYCNHDAVAVRGGYCECGAKVD